MKFPTKMVLNAFAGDVPLATIDVVVTLSIQHRLRQWFGMRLLLLGARLLNCETRINDQR